MAKIQKIQIEDVFLLNTGDVGTGVYDFGGATSLELPNSATPTVNADGEIAFDTTVTDFSTGLLKFYGGEEQGIVAMPIAEFTSPTDGHVVAYNATNDEFELVAQSGGSGITSINSETGAAQTLAVGTAGTDFAIATTTDTNTFNLPDASASARGVVTTGSQTFGGNKTLTGDTKLDGTLNLSSGSQDYIFADRGTAMTLQSQNSGTATQLELHSKDGDATDNVLFNMYATGTPASVTNRSRLQMGYIASVAEFRIFTEASGTGNSYAISLFTEGNADQFNLLTDGSNTMSGALTVAGLITASVGWTTSGGGLQTMEQTANWNIQENRTSIASSQNDYPLDSFITHLSNTSGGSINITGIAFQDVTWYRIYNIGSQDIVLKNQDGASAPSSQFKFSTGADLTLGPLETIDLMYDSTNQIWNDFSYSPSATNTGFLKNVVEDLSPQAGADFDMNAFDLKFDDATGIRDDSDNEQLIFQKVTNAVNYLEITNSISTVAPILASTGSDTDVGLDLVTKGRGSTIIKSGAGTVTGLVVSTAVSGVNYLIITPSATGNDVSIATAGTDGDIDLALTPKADGALVLDGQKFPTSAGTNGQVLTTDGTDASWQDAAPGYTEKMAVFGALGADGTWTNVDLSGGAFTVPASAVCEILIENTNSGAEKTAGVRTNGSALSRFTDLAEAEAGGVTPVTMNVQADASSIIEAYAETDSDITFTLIGYWS